MEDASAAAFIPLCGLGGKHRVLGRSKKARESPAYAKAPARQARNNANFHGDRTEFEFPFFESAQLDSTFAQWRARR
jgi:hypothetical protein